MTAPVCTSSFSFSFGWTYDVFLSFRGEDTRHGFTGSLYNALREKGIHTFIDDEQLQRGNQITPSLVKAIEGSRIAIIVLSKNYASSSFCLDELVNILGCIKKKGGLALPVFYDVDPSDVRHQRGNYREALTKHEEKLKGNIERLEKWKMALQQVANLSGWHFKHGDGYEYEFIGRIVEVVSNMINRAPLHVAHYPVGLESRVLHVKSLLCAGSDDGVHMVGIHGIGGIGKTTVARAVYNLIAYQFEGLCFLDDVRKNSIKHGLVHLQETLLSEIVGEKDIKLGSVNKGIPIIKHRLHQKKVLLVIDDVDELEQLWATVGGPDWFGSGSRVIITTRDKHLLTSHGVQRTYEVEELNNIEALELVSWNAFKTDKVDPSYVHILNRAITYASGLPLALEVIGSYLFGKRIEEWESALDQYERIPNKVIQKILKVSFDSLEEDEQNIFLDIACCFKGYALAYVKEILYAHHAVCPEYGIGVLIEKSLIKINVDGHLTLHDLIEEMGKEIVQKESPQEPGKRSRLWFLDDIVQVLEENTDTGIKELPFSIRYLTRLRRLELHSCGMLYLPSSIIMLPELEQLSVWTCEGLQSSKEDEGEEIVSSMLSSNMEYLDLTGCNISDEFLRKCLTWFANVKYLDLSHNNFTILPACIKECRFLRKLNLDYCKLLRENKGIPPNLGTFSAQGCTSLNDLDLKALPACTEECHSLRELILDDCENLQEITGILSNIELLSAKNCKSLTSSCRSMLLNQELHEEAGYKKFILPGARIPEWFEHRSKGLSISFWFRNKFPTISLCFACGQVDHNFFLPNRFYPEVIIKGNEVNKRFPINKAHYSWFSQVADHICIFDEKQIKFEDGVDEVLLGNRWNHVEVSLVVNTSFPKEMFTIQIGLHIVKQESCMEDIRFTNPYKRAN